MNIRLVLSMVVVSAVIQGCGKAIPADGEIEKVRIGNQDFSLRISSSNETRERGLGERTELEDGEGMLFVFPDAKRRGFWMYGCLMDIDIAFLDPLGHVTAIHTMPFEPPQGDDEDTLDYEERLPRYSSGFPAQFAIELSPGMFEDLGIRKGDRLHIDLDRMKAIAANSEPTRQLPPSK